MGLNEKFFVSAASSPAPSNSTLFLDPSNINSYPGTGTTWTDLSTNSNNATLNNMTFIGTAGTNGYFTITNRATSYARLPANIPSLGWGNNQTTDLSFSIWYYPTEASLFSYVFNKTSPPYEYALIDEPTANRLFFLLQNSSGGNVSITQITLPARNQWHNIIITLQATSTGVKIYNNNSTGSAVPGSGYGIMPNAMSTTNQLSIGTGPYASVNDRIAKFSCYNTVLTQTEMADIFNAGHGA